MANHDVIILGAGLSGLACALTLQKSNVKALLIEPGAAVGGRVKTRTTREGFKLDEGFQVILNSYPELEKFVDLAKLNLKKFNSGALIFNGDTLDLLGNPLVHPETLVSTFFKESLTTKDKALVVKLLAVSQLQRDDFPLGSNSTMNYLREFGFSEKFIEFFWRPFLAGVYLDSELNLGANFFKFLIRCFATGKVSIPQNGMCELPAQMAAQLPKDSIFLGQSAETWSGDHVILSGGEKLLAKQIVCTFQPKNAQRNEYHSVETIYFTSPHLKEMPWGKWLVLVPQKLGMGISHFCLLSAVSESYGNGKPLLSVSVVGNKNLELEQICREMDHIAKTALKLELIERVRVEKALPVVSGNAEGFTIIDNVIYCGDRWASPSINGALRSGRMAAEYMVSKLSNRK